MATSENIGRFVWYDLMTADPKAAEEFYTGLIGWGTQEWEEGDKPYTMWVNGEKPLGGVMEMPLELRESGVYQLYGRGEAPLGGMFNKPDEMPGPPMWLYYVSVDDMNSAVQKVEELGGQVINGTMEVPGGDLIAQCLDPQGALFALHSTSG